MISSSFLSTFWVLLCSTAVGYLKNWVEIIWSKWGANHLMVCQFFFFFVLQNSWWGLGNEPPQWVICRWMPAYLMRFSCSVKSLHKLYMHEPPQHSLACPDVELERSRCREHRGSPGFWRFQLYSQHAANLVVGFTAWSVFCFTSERIVNSNFVFE